MVNANDLNSIYNYTQRKENLPNELIFVSINVVFEFIRIRFYFGFSIK